MTIAIVMFLIVASAVASEAQTTSASRVRPQSPRADALLHDAVRRSATVAGLLATIEASDVLVFLDVVSDPAALAGRTAILGVTEQARLLHVALSGHESADRLVELFGHELQHVVEIAQTPEVRDQFSLARAFERLGWQFECGHFETEAARQTERSVHADIQAARAPRYRKKS
jgi:hypothetical protein